MFDYFTASSNQLPHFVHQFEKVKFVTGSREIIPFWAEARWLQPAKQPREHELRSSRIIAMMPAYIRRGLRSLTLLGGSAV
jgi:hypothetical protein